MPTLKKNFEYPDIKQTDYIDESLEKIKARDDASKNSFGMQGTFPSPVTEDDIGRKVYRADLNAEYRLVSVDPDPKWIPVTDETGTPVTRETINANFQPINQNLTSLSNLSGNNDQMAYFASKNDLQLTALSSFARELLGKFNAQEIRTLLGLGDVAILNTPIDGGLIKDGTIYNEKLDKTSNSTIFFHTGDVVPTLAKQAPAGWIMADDGTIGSATSGATHASNDTRALFELLWSYPFTQIYTVTGAPSNKSSRYDLDWNANKRLQVPRMAGRVLGCAGQGAGLTVRRVGDSLGTERETLNINQIPNHNHGDLDSYFGVIGSKNGIYNCKMLGSKQYNTQGFYFQGWANENYTVGGNQAHNNMQPTIFINYRIKL